jgi:hypothetical protein
MIPAFSFSQTCRRLGRPSFFLALAVVITFTASPFASAATPSKTVPPPATPPAPTHGAPEYYFTIDLDPQYQFTGTGALTPEAAANSNCYCFTYNPDGKLQRIEYRIAGTPMPDPLLGVARIDFEYAPGIERRWFRDAQGKPMANSDGAQGEELTLNAAGFPTKVTNLDASGSHIRDSSGVISYLRELDAANRLITGHRVGLFGSPITDDNGLYETHTTYDEQGYAIERSNFDSSGKPLNNADGFAFDRTTYTIYPDSTQTSESFFDASSLPVEDKSGGVHEIRRVVDKRGLLVDVAYFDSTGAPTVISENGVHERRYTYDDRGNKLTEEFFDVDGKPYEQKGPDFAKVVYTYDDKNRVVEEAFFGDDETAQVVPSIGAAVIRLTYNKFGVPVRTAYLDGQGHPCKHQRYGVEAIHTRVEGDTTYVTLETADGKPAKNPVSGYYGFSYKTATDKPLSFTNTFYDRHGRQMSLLRVKFINPHLYALRSTLFMDWSARGGALAAGLGAVLGAWMALRKSSHTKRRKVYVPTPIERFLGWVAVLAILDGALIFFLTLYWAWLAYVTGQVGFVQMVGYNSRLAADWNNYQRGPLEYSIYVCETIFLIFMFYRLYRQTKTMRVLNILRDDIHRLVREFFEKAGQKPEWIAGRNCYVTPPLDVRVNYFEQKFHAYLAFHHRGDAGRKMERDIAEFLRAQAGGILGPARTQMLAVYYPLVAFCYLVLAALAFYTLFQVVKGY